MHPSKLQVSSIKYEKSKVFWYSFSLKLLPDVKVGSTDISLLQIPWKSVSSLSRMEKKNGHGMPNYRARISASSIEELGDLGDKLLVISLCVSVQGQRFHFILIFEFSNSENMLIICTPQFLAISYIEYHSESAKTSLNHSHAKTYYLHVICYLLLCHWLLRSSEVWISIF